MIIPGFNNYDITEDGIVTRVDTGKVLKRYLYTLPSGKQYYHVSLIRDDYNEVAVPHSIMRLLALTYLPPRPANYVACAKDGNNLNTVVSNVEWRDRADVSRVHMKVDRKKRTSMHCNEETKATLLFAMKALDEPLTMTELAVTLEVPYSTIRYSMAALIKEHKVKKTIRGYEVIK